MERIHTVSYHQFNFDTHATCNMLHCSLRSLHLFCLSLMRCVDSVSEAFFRGFQQFKINLLRKMEVLVNDLCGLRPNNEVWVSSDLLYCTPRETKLWYIILQLNQLISGMWWYYTEGIVILKRALMPNNWEEIRWKKISFSPVCMYGTLICTWNNHLWWICFRIFVFSYFYVNTMDHAVLVQHLNVYV